MASSSTSTPFSQVLLKVSVELSETQVETLYVTEGSLRTEDGIALLAQQFCRQHELDA